VKINHKMAVILLTVTALLAPLTGLAADTPPDGAAIAAQAIEQASQEIEKTFAHHNSGEEIGQALLIPILGIIGVFFAPMLAIIIIAVLAFRHRDRKQQRNHETIRQMIEKGMQIPPNISFGETSESALPLNKGLKYMGVGAGLIVFFIVMGMKGLAGIGAIPLFVGLAYLATWYFEKKQTVTGSVG
jgi:hypothetical protein